MSRLLTKTLAAVALSTAITGLAAAPAHADVTLPPRTTGSAGVDAGSTALQAGSAAIVTPIVGTLIRSLCTLSTGDPICGLHDL
ncbi:hypothetical protein LTV02_24280 [Nocardia yamanashiensis]|uniref:hypothetical protein n=1 Tax=Nocardia yamanashiensis TaxID=209247 RepID=UPI001E3D3EDE|nr:hypothetical protein [Nocardia yamanashiensis]UGT39200.1 hypothetical protein LTV02_24280 [Nocardia yamanashiensis]